MTPCCYKIILGEVLATTTVITIAITITADAVKDNYDNDDPENPFATATVIVISKAHKSSSFQF